MDIFLCYDQGNVHFQDNIMATKPNGGIDKTVIHSDYMSFYPPDFLNIANKNQNMLLCSIFHN